MLTTSHSLLKSIILLEVSRYKQEMGSKPPSWKEQLNAYEKQDGLFVHFSNYPKMGLYFDEANLSGMKGWETADFSGSIYDNDTEFPPGFDPNEKGMVRRKTESE